MKPHSDPWVGHCPFRDESILPEERFGGSQTKHDPFCQLDLVKQSFDQELVKDKHFEIVYVAVEAFPSFAAGEWARYVVAYRCSNPLWKKGARGVVETEPHLAYFTPFEHAILWQGLAS